jgi:4-hydroxy-tetrahydrodipicolinate reductase
LERAPRGAAIAGAIWRQGASLPNPSGWRDHQVAEIAALNLALLGYGKMGKTIAGIAAERGFQIKLILDEHSNRAGGGITAEKFQGVDACVDFTEPSSVLENILRVAALGCPMVVGTTGWFDHIEEARSIVEKSGSGLVYSANFSIGVQLFYRMARATAQIAAAFPMYEPFITESHHRFKKDAPSGTALELKSQVQPVLGTREIPVASVRAGYIPGTHELGFDSEADTILLRHTARSRRGFAEGALYAARWIVGRKGFFNFSEILNEPARG